jgi:DNA recombination protein RmuC
MNLVIATLAGVIAGFLLGLIVAGRRAKPASDAGLEGELRRQLTDRDSLLAAAAEREKTLIRQQSAALAERDAARETVSRQQALHDKALLDLREAFKALSADALKQSAPEFVRLATDQFARLQESAKGDLSQRQEAIAGLLKPLVTQLETYQQRLQQSEVSASSTPPNAWSTAIAAIANCAAIRRRCASPAHRWRR